MDDDDIQAQLIRLIETIVIARRLHVYYFQNVVNLVWETCSLRLSRYIRPWFQLDPKKMYLNSLVFHFNILLERNDL